MNNLSNKTLALVPHRLFSLWEMIQFSAQDFVVLQRLKSTQHILNVLKEEKPAGFPDEKKRLQLVGVLNRVTRLWVKIDLKGEAEMIKKVIHHLNNAPHKNYSELTQVIEIIISKTRAELELRSFAYIPVGNAKFFEQDELFGKAVKDSASPQLNAEIKAAGNCLAADEHTAAVFHLMRVAEHGLLALANYLGAKPKKSWPLEFSEWQDVLAAIDDELGRRKAALGLPRGSALDQELEFYDGLMKDLVYFKDAYRNPVSHLRGIYDRDKARVVFNDVRDFMVRLAPRVPLR